MISKHVDRHKSGVYKITNLVNNKIYIGSSVEVYNRKHTHINKLKNKLHSSKHLEAAYHKYGADNFLFEVLEYCDKAVITEREQYYIDLLKPEYNKRIFAQNNIGNSPSQEVRDKIANTLREKYSQGLKSYNQSHRARIVEQYSLKGELVNTFTSPKNAEEYLDIKSCISKACRKESKYTLGFQWKYKDSDKIISSNCDGTIQGKEVTVKNVILNKEKKFSSLIKCVKYFNTTRKSLYKYLNTNNLYKGKYIIWQTDAQNKSRELLEKLVVANQQPSIDGNTMKVQRLVEFVPVTDSSNYYADGETTTSAGLLGFF